MEENLKIDILERWSLWTVLLPYYGQWHEGYLILSAFSHRSRRNLIINYSAYLFSMRSNRKAIIFNEEGKPFDVRNQLMKILKNYPLDFFSPKVILYTQKWFTEFMNYLVSKQKHQKYLEKLNQLNKFWKIDWSKLWMKTEWDKIIVTGFIMKENINKYLEVILKITKTDPEFDKVFFIQGKSWIKYSNDYSLVIPEIESFRNKKHSRLLTSPFKIDSLWFSLFTQDSFKSVLSSLKSSGVSVETLSIPSSLDPNFHFLSSLSYMNPVLKHLNLTYSPLMPIQYYLLKDLNLNSISIKLEPAIRKIFDLDILNFLNDEITFQLSDPQPNIPFWRMKWGQGYFNLFNKAKWNSSLYKWDSIEIDFLANDKKIFLKSDENYLYLHTLGNLKITGLSNVNSKELKEAERSLYKSEEIAFDEEVKANDIIIIPHKYASNFKLDISKRNLSEALDDMIKIKQILKTVEKCKLVEVEFTTTEDKKEPYQIMIQMFPKHTYYFITVSDELVIDRQIIDILEIYSFSNIKSIKILHYKAWDITFTDEEGERICALISTDSWKDNLEILEIYLENTAMLPKLLRAVTRLRNIKELELKWKVESKKIKTCNKVISRKTKIFDGLTRFIFEKWIK